MAARVRFKKFRRPKIRLLDGSYASKFTCVSKKDLTATGNEIRANKVNIYCTKHGSKGIFARTHIGFKLLPVLRRTLSRGCIHKPRRTDRHDSVADRLYRCADSTSVCTLPSNVGPWSMCSIQPNANIMT